MELWEEINLKQNQLDQALKTFRTNGTALADAERIYKEAVSKEALKLRDEGMAVSLIDKVIYGLPSISTLRFNRDVAKVVYDANIEAINIKKLELRILQRQFEVDYKEEE